MVTQQENNIDTTIRVKIITRDRLIKLGGKMDSYDDIIQRLLDSFEKSSATQ